VELFTINSQILLWHTELLKTAQHAELVLTNVRRMHYCRGYLRNWRRWMHWLRSMCCSLSGRRYFSRI